MPKLRQIKGALRAAAIVCLLLTLTPGSPAERLPIKTYTTEEGLIRNLIRHILEDSNGYLWLVTPSGLSRFDGYEFKNYLAGDYPFLSFSWDMIEDRNGGFWIATAGNGLYRFRPEASSKTGAFRFEPYSLGPTPQAAFVNTLLQDRSGKIWCGANAGLFCLDETNGEAEFHPVDLGLKTKETAPAAIEDITEDQEGNLWFGTHSGLFRRLPDGRIVRYRFPVSDPEVGHLFSDRDRRLWIEHSTGLIVFMPGPASSVTGDVIPRFLPTSTRAKQTGGNLRLPDHPNQWLLLNESNGFAGRDITGACQASDGYLWFGDYDKGLFRFDGKRFRLYTQAEGLSHYKIRSLAEDGEGNLWIGTDGGGLMKKARGGFTGFSAADGIDETVIAFMFDDPAGNVCIATDLARVVRFDGERFKAIQTAPLDELIRNVVSDRMHFYYGNPVFKDHAGELWFSTGSGLFRYPRIDRIGQFASSPPRAIYTTRDGLPSNNIYRAFEDSRGDVWVSFLDTSKGLLCKWDRAADSFRVFGRDDGLTASQPVASMCEDKNGNMWFGFGVRSAKDGLMARYDGKGFRLFSKEDGVPEGGIRDLFVDSKGRLWIASSVGGLASVDNPEAEHPSFARYTIADGLADNEINCLAEDQWGSIYVGMGRGLDRLDPATGRVRHFTGADGLGNDDIRKIFRDSRMNLWIGTSKGLFRFTPEPETSRPAPPILITKLTIAGEEQPISELGEKLLVEPDLEVSRNNLQIEFVSPNFSFTTTQKYEYKLEGADADWSPPTLHRAVNYANLSPGRYRFMVRAVRADGSSSEAPAVMSFMILPPIWQRWWFVTGALVLMAIPAAAFGRYRYHQRKAVRAAQQALRKSREERLAELERVRGRIAADLHDDIGSNLTRISLISEVAQRKLDGADPPVGEHLSSIGKLSRELVDSMSDIVWAINPHKDHLADLSQRMRHFASDLFTARQVQFRFTAVDFDRDIQVGANLRREFFLIFKEGVNNIARHSACTEAEIELLTGEDNLVLILSDNGKGFDLSKSSTGHGLVSMRERTRALGGELEMSSTPGQGAILRFVIPLHPHTDDFQQAAENL